MTRKSIVRRIAVVVFGLALADLFALPCSDARSTAAARPITVRQAQRSIPSARADSVPRYQVIDLGTLGGNTSWGSAINATGDVAGEAQVRSRTAAAISHLTTWRNGKLRDLGLKASASGINKLGQIVGMYDTNRGAYHAFLWQKGKLHDLGTLGGPNSCAHALNDHGWVVGGADFETEGYTDEHAFLWRGGKMIDLRTSHSYALATNNTGVIVGAFHPTLNGPLHACLWRNGRVRDLGALGARDSEAHAINDRGDVVGWSGTVGFVYTGGRMDELPSAYGGACVALAINHAGVIVGQMAPPRMLDVIEKANPSGEGVGRAAIWIRRRVFDLNYLVPKQSGWYLAAAEGINDRGQVIASGIRNGRSHALLLNPLGRTGVWSNAQPTHEPDCCPFTRTPRLDGPAGDTMMPDELNLTELNRLLSNLQHQNEATRLEAIQRLQRLVGEAARHVTEGKHASEADQMRAWDEARRRILNRPEIADAVVTALDDSSPRVRATAALQAWNVDSERATRGLIEHLLRDPHDHVRMMCVAALRGRKNPAAVEAFVQALQDQQEKVVFPACMSLGELGDARAIEPLRKMLDHPSWNVRYCACEALVRLDAVDRRVVDVLEILVALPEAAEHDKLVKSAHELEREFYEEGEASLTCRELLEVARHALDLAADNDNEKEE